MNYTQLMEAEFAAGRASRDAEVEGLRADAEKWKEITMQLGQRVNFAITHLDGKGSAMMNMEDGTLTGWREYLADGMEMIPGVTIDKEMLGVLALPKSKQKAAREKIKAARKEKQA